MDFLTEHWLSVGVGVFWLSCAAWAFTLVAAYKTARLYVCGASAYVAALAVALFGLFPVLHNETRCEDFALSFVSAALYAVCAQLQGGGQRYYRSLVSIVFGASVTATFMLKFNIAAMLVPLALTFLWAVRGRRWQAVAYMLIGASAVVLPFVIYFTSKGILPLFFNEYVLKTLQPQATAMCKACLACCHRHVVSCCCSCCCSPVWACGVRCV